MSILWDDKKNKKLIKERGLSLETFESLIIENKFLAVLKNPSRNDQKIFIIPYQNYTYVVPFTVDKNQDMILKTVFPSRKYHKIFGGKNET